MVKNLPMEVNGLYCHKMYLNSESETVGTDSHGCLWVVPVQRLDKGGGLRQSPLVITR